MHSDAAVVEVSDSPRIDNETNWERSINVGEANEKHGEQVKALLRAFQSM